MMMKKASQNFIAREHKQEKEERVCVVASKLKVDHHQYLALHWSASLELRVT
jgi:hypothetical protein